MDSGGEGEGGKIWENGIETCIISCMKRKKKKEMSSFLKAKQLKVTHGETNHFNRNLISI